MVASRLDRWSCGICYTCKTICTRPGASRLAGDAEEGRAGMFKSILIANRGEIASA